MALESLGGWTTEQYPMAHSDNSLDNLIPLFKKLFYATEWKINQDSGGSLQISALARRRESKKVVWPDLRS